MAFTTRLERRLAFPALVGTVSRVALVLCLAASLAVAVIPLLWVMVALGFSPLRELGGELLGSGSVLAVLLACLAAVWACVVLSSVVSPDSSLGALADQCRAARTFWWMLGWGASLAIFGGTLPWHPHIEVVRIGLLPVSVALCSTMSAIGAFRIIASARMKPLYDGFTDGELSMIERPPTRRLLRDFPEASEVPTRQAAVLYSRRAHVAGTTRYWTGSVMLLVFSGLIVPAFVWSINDLKAGFWAALPVVAIAIAGQALQRRARTFYGLQRAFDERARALSAPPAGARARPHFTWPWTKRDAHAVEQ